MGNEEAIMESCRDVMTEDPICCLPQDTVDKVAQIMKREDIGSVPVVTSHDTNKLIGIVTDRDLALKVVGEGRNPRQTEVEAVLTPQPWTCLADDLLSVAVKIMSERQVRRIPVVDESGHILGIIAQADIATRTADAQQTAEVVEEISQPGDGPAKH
jgi:CBS domain-containing protein